MFGPEEPGTRGPFRGREKGFKDEVRELVIHCKDVRVEGQKFTGT